MLTSQKYYKKQSDIDAVRKKKLLIDRIFYFIPHPVIKKECKSYLNVSYTVHDYHSKIRDRIHIGHIRRGRFQPEVS